MTVTDQLRGFGVTFATMFKKVVTEQYPEEKKPTEPRFHGRHLLNRHPDGLELSTAVTRKLLAMYGIDAWGAIPVTNEDAAVAAALELGLPVMLTSLDPRFLDRRVVPVVPGLVVRFGGCRHHALDGLPGSHLQNRYDWRAAAIAGLLRDQGARSECGPGTGRPGAPSLEAAGARLR